MLKCYKRCNTIDDSLVKTDVELFIIGKSLLQINIIIKLRRFYWFIAAGVLMHVLS